MKRTVTTQVLPLRVVTSSSPKRSTWQGRSSVILLITGITLGQFTYHIINDLTKRHAQRITCVLSPWHIQMVDATRQPVQLKGGDRSPAPISGLLFVGVMTSWKHLHTRAKAIQETWGSAQNGSLLFFVGRGEKVNSSLPIQVLDNVVDSDYPPQRKSFAMLEYIYQHFGQKYEWFMRADDDLFVDVNRLKRLLYSLNTSRPLYLGHPGTGKPDEEGRLGLKNGNPYCMGGTGVVLSRQLLASLVAPGILNSCLQNTVSDHEDSELGRCIHNVTGLSCIQSEQIFRRFKQNYGETSGEWIKKAFGRTAHRGYVTFHPIKDTRYMYFSATYLETLRISELRSKVRQLQTVIDCLSTELSQLKTKSGLSDEKPLGGTCLYGNCSSANTDLLRCIIGGKIRENVFYADEFPADSPWFLIQHNNLFTPWRNDLKKPVSQAGVSIGLGKALHHLSRYVLSQGSHSKTSRHVAVDNFYQRVIPYSRVDYMIFVRRDMSSAIRPYIVRQIFDELIISEKD